MVILTVGSYLWKVHPFSQIEKKIHSAVRNPLNCVLRIVLSQLIDTEIQGSTLFGHTDCINYYVLQSEWQNVQCEMFLTVLIIVPEKEETNQLTNFGLF